ncbi:MAG: hypothetical protein RMX96_01500 [Nostoc sp. ChiSLP02]|nr:hypothetical protein [Nostoc sp. DedSLP05]MDZ8183523.1 hypothetical protein [Nostoc sp. ChiSLP02]
MPINIQVVASKECDRFYSECDRTLYVFSIENKACIKGLKWNVTLVKIKRRHGSLLGVLWV